MDETTRNHESSLIRVFTEHPESVGETYTQHMFSALSFSLMMARAAVCCAVHAFLPFLFTATGSRIVEELANGTAQKAGAQASLAARAISDIRASQEFRTDMTSVLTERSIRRCAEILGDY